MAIYHLSVKSVGRGSGRSATAAAAYRSGSEIADERTGEDYDYTRKQGVEHAKIVLPDYAGQNDINWPRDRAALWNAAELAEKRKDARVAREYEVALPAELDDAQRLELVREFSRDIANRYGCAVDFASTRRTARVISATTTPTCWRRPGRSRPPAWATRRQSSCPTPIARRGICRPRPST